MGILYSVKFQVFHEETWLTKEDSSPAEVGITTIGSILQQLHRLLEILDIVDIRRKKALGIQMQLTRHVAVLKYHRHHQEKEFLVSDSFNPFAFDMPF